MQIDKISFKGVYRYGKFTPIQYKISENIKNTLMSDYNADSKGRTPNDILAKKGYDTVLYPNGEITDLDQADGARYRAVTVGNSED